MHFGYDKNLETTRIDKNRKIFKTKYNVTRHYQRNFLLPAENKNKKILHQ